MTAIGYLMTKPHNFIALKPNKPLPFIAPGGGLVHLRMVKVIFAMDAMDGSCSKFILMSVLGLLRFDTFAQSNADTVQKSDEGSGIALLLAESDGRRNIPGDSKPWKGYFKTISGERLKTRADVANSQG